MYIGFFIFLTVMVIIGYLALRKPLTFPISYLNYMDTSYGKRVASHQLTVINVKTGETEEQEIHYGGGYITLEQFKVKQKLAKIAAEEMLGKEHPKVKVLECYMNTQNS